MTLDSYLKSYTKINLKLVKDLTIRPESIKLLGKASWHWIWQGFPEYDTRSPGNKSKIMQVRLHHI